MPVMLVVGAALIRDGRVLATRRTRPPEAAGGWELPGGKVEAGETPQDALVREVREELGCEVRVTGALAGEQPVGPGLTLRVLRAEPVTGDPTPHEHDALRWLGPEELDDVAWLGPDLPFLAELRELLLDGRALEGGNTGGAVRIGATVRRPTGPWTPAVHRLLAHVAARGLSAVPEVLGEDARGREALSYLPGTVVDVDEDLLTDAQLAGTARWARELHEAVADLDRTGPWRFFDVEATTVLGHNDLAPYNLCFEGDRLSGVFDWDLAGPTTPLLELAQLAWTAVPLFRPVPAAEAVRRLRLLADAYGGVDARDVLRAVPLLKRIGCDGIRQWIASGDPAGRSQLAVGEPERTEHAVALLRDRMPDLERELS